MENETILKHIEFLETTYAKMLATVKDTIMMAYTAGQADTLKGIIAKMQGEQAEDDV